MMRMNLPVVGLALSFSLVVGCGSEVESSTQVETALAALTFTAQPVMGTQSGRCWDLANSTTTAGAQVELYACSGGTNQSWTYDSSKRLTIYGNRCLDASGQGRTPGTKVIIWSCNGQTNQQWNVNADGTIVGVQSGLCVEAAGSGTANGTLLQLGTCSGGANQSWKVSNVATSYSLAISVSGSGSTTPTAGTYAYAAGTAVSVTATPATGSQFTGWSGAATGTANPVTVTMDGNKTLTANFSNGPTPTLSFQTGSFGEISSLKIIGDTYPTNYVLNASNARSLASTSEHHWFGELMFKYRVGTATAWSTASSSDSGDVRSIATGTNSTTVTYQNSASATGIRNFKVVESYALVDDYLAWTITVTNTSGQALEIGDFGLPLPWNSYWFGGGVIYEERVQNHSFVGNNSSYIRVTRPSGVGPFLLMVPDTTTGAGFEYRDRWHVQEHSGSLWAAGQGSPSWPDGLNVFYIHSNVIKSTQRGYLPNTSLSLAAGASKTYAFKIIKVTSEQEMKNRLYAEGLIDVTVVPGMAFPTDLTAKVDLHTSKAIASLAAQYPSETTITSLGTVGTDHKLYQVRLSHLGQNNVTVSYGDGEKTILQFYAMEPAGAALQRHATHIATRTQWTESVDLHGIFDDWMMRAQARRGAVGGWGWGDDWGWTHGEFLAEKNAQSPVAAEVAALDVYLDAVWNRSIDHSTYVVQDWWCPAGTSPTNINNCYYDRSYAYPHAINTYFGMYKIAHLYPGLVSYHNPADTYLMRAYNILWRLHIGRGDYGTGYMGEQTLPEIRQALSDAGHTTEANNVATIIRNVYNAFASNTYPYGSEYSFDNTGEEAVYMSAKENGNNTMLSKINAKTRACRGQQPTWYHYADPVTLNGEGWWQFQYTMSLAGYCMDDWLRYHSTQPEVDERLSYAAKLGNLTAINSGQIDSAAANLGAVAWTYQAEKGLQYMCSADCSDTLHNGWRGMSGEADLGLFGAIRILSADVAVDPIFGLYGYGCDVASSNGCYTVTPRDGVQKRLNLITEKVYLELDRDQYTSATLSTSKNYVAFTLGNQYTLAAHTTRATLRGLAAGTYTLTVNGAAAGTVSVTAGQPAVFNVSVGTSATYRVVIAAAGASCG